MSIGRAAVLPALVLFLTLAAGTRAVSQDQFCDRIQFLKKAAPNDFEELPATPDLFGGLPGTYITRFVPVAFKGATSDATVLPQIDGSYLYTCTWSYGYGLQEQARAAADAALLAAEIRKCAGGALESLVDGKDKALTTHQVFPDGLPDGKSRRTIFTVQSNPRLSLSPVSGPDASRQGILSLTVEARK